MSIRVDFNRAPVSIFGPVDLFIKDSTVIKDRYFRKPESTNAESWVLDRLQEYLAPGSRIEEIKYDVDHTLTVIGMGGRIYIGQEANQEVREEVSKRSAWDYV